MEINKIVTDNGDGTVTLKKEVLKNLFEAHGQMNADIELVINSVARILVILAIITQDGEIRKDFRMRHLVRSLTQIVSESMFGMDSLEKKFAFLTDPKVMEVLEKYSYVYRKSSIRKGSIKELTFEDIIKKVE